MNWTKCLQLFFLFTLNTIIQFTIINTCFIAPFYVCWDLVRVFTHRCFRHFVRCPTTTNWIWKCWNMAQIQMRYWFRCWYEAPNAFNYQKHQQQMIKWINSRVLVPPQVLAELAQKNCKRLKLSRKKLELDLQEPMSKIKTNTATQNTVGKRFKPKWAPIDNNSSIVSLKTWFGPMVFHAIYF